MPRKNSCTWGLGDTSISAKRTESETRSCGGLGCCMNLFKKRKNQAKLNNILLEQ